MNGSVVKRVLVLVISAAGLTLAGSAPASAGGGCHRPGQTERAGTVVEMDGNCFGPTVLRTDLGAEVTFHNADTWEHELSGVGWGAPGPLRHGATFTRTFSELGTYPFSCALHPGMNGAIVVGGGKAGGPVASVADRAAPAAPAPQLTASAPPPAREDAAAPVLAIAVGAIGFGAGWLTRRGPRPR